jgi:hypothetical protein
MTCLQDYESVHYWRVVQRIEETDGGKPPRRQQLGVFLEAVGFKKFQFG